MWVADCTPSESGLPAISPFLLETVGGSDGSGKRNRPGVWATFESAKQLAFDYFRQPGRAQSDAVPRSISLSADFGMAAVLRKDSLTVMPIMGRVSVHPVRMKLVLQVAVGMPVTFFF